MILFTICAYAVYASKLCTKTRSTPDPEPSRVAKESTLQTKKSFCISCYPSRLGTKFHVLISLYLDRCLGTKNDSEHACLWSGLLW